MHKTTLIAALIVAATASFAASAQSLVSLSTGNPARLASHKLSMSLQLSVRSTPPSVKSR